MIEVKSQTELIENLNKQERAFLLLYKSGSEKSDCAYQAVEKTVNLLKKTTIFYADVNQVRDIHPNYKITSVPTLIEFKHDEMKSIVKGCHGEAYYKTIFEHNAFISKGTDKKPRKNVIVYSTPTCPHCTTLKNYLHKQKIAFRDIDVSKNQSAAQAMVKKSGQQGVPQTNINGQVVVGFDKAKIDRLLDLKPE